ncbi:MAG: phosphatase PAP2 family protein [Xanthobacteraceae bacterium]|uniref:phosphatase PAP2 family protein n=1 Tax=Pseudolabrys sp. TaxID=1960880 RepID=UPI003D153517
MTTSATGDARNDRWPRRMAMHIGAALRLLSRPARGRPAAAFNWPRWAVAVAVALAVLLVIALLLDAPLARGARALPRWPVDLFDAVTTFGKSGWFLWPVGVVLLAIAALPARLPERSRLVLIALVVRLEFLFAAIAIPGVAVNILKHVIGRGRPYVGGSLDPFHMNPFSWPAAYASMPSGHAATAGAVAVAVATLWPRSRVVVLIYVVVILASRVVLTAHYLSDVLAGAAVGAGGAMLIRHYFATRRLGFSIGPDGRIVAFPMPSLRRIKAVARGLLSE